MNILLKPVNDAVHSQGGVKAVTREEVGRGELMLLVQVFSLVSWASSDQAEVSPVDHVTAWQQIHPGVSFPAHWSQNKTWKTLSSLGLPKPQILPQIQSQSPRVTGPLSLRDSGQSSYPSLSSFRGGRQSRAVLGLQPRTPDRHFHHHVLFACVSVSSGVFFTGHLCLEPT